MNFLSGLFSQINLYYIPAALLCITVHECSHGYAAYLSGDPTAKDSGRLSLNPLRHLDPVGFGMLVLFGFGWAKPVPVDPRFFRNPRRGMAITSLAGPVSNFILAYILFFLLEAIFFFLPINAVTKVLYNLLMYAAVLSIGLGVFNLIPISPLDGSKILFSFLPERHYYTILRYERYGFILLIGLLYLNLLDGPITAVRNWMMDSIWYAASLPFQFLASFF